jgi:hypothetical protein
VDASFTKMRMRCPALNRAVEDTCNRHRCSRHSLHVSKHSGLSRHAGLACKLDNLANTTVHVEEGREGREGSAKQRKAAMSRSPG